LKLFGACYFIFCKNGANALKDNATGEQNAAIWKKIIVRRTANLVIGG